MWSITTSTSATDATGRGGRGPGEGLFIAFEGIEGSGKSTQIQRVAEALAERGRDPLVTREPGGTELGEAVRGIVLDDGLRPNRIAELFLMLAARSAFVEEVVRPALDAGRIVLSDRYDLSTLAYQGGGRGIPMDRVRDLNDFATGGLRADLYIVLDVAVDQGLGRRELGESDRIEREDLAFHRKVAQAYQRLARTDPDVALVNGRGEIEDVFAAVWATLAARFPETFPSP